MKPTALTLYTTATCNLNCSYCYIDKNPSLVAIDKMLDESFQGDYYINFMKEMFPEPEFLTRLEIWGGEPTLRLDRAFYTISQMVNYFPNFHEIMFSTNFTTDNWFEQFDGLLETLKQIKRNFSLQIQLSLDGPEKINDLGRGKGSTKKFIEHWLKLLKYGEHLEKIPSNVEVKFHFKPTLSITTIPLLQTKESIIAYYQFFEKFKESIEYYENNNFLLELTLPNTAVPSPHTIEDGKLFANLCKLCREIEKENQDQHYFKYYKRITPFPAREEWNHGCSNVCDSCGACGMGVFIIGLLPHKRISLCHNGFVDLISDYKKRCMEDKNLLKHSVDSELFNRNTDVRDTNCTQEEYKVIREMLESFYNEDSSFQLSQLVITIQTLAMTGMIDKKYLNRKEAIEAAHFLQHSTSYCIRDNLGSSGTMIGYPIGLIKLLLNGAKEYIYDYEQ